MTWNNLPTYTNGTLTAAQLMAIRDNIYESAAAKATTARGYFVATGPNALAERFVYHDEVITTGTTTSGSYANPAGDNGPDVDIVTGTACVIHHSLQLENSASGSTWGSLDITGATTVAVTDRWAVMTQAGAANGTRSGVTTWFSMTAGASNVNMLFRVSSGTGSFDDRRIVVHAL